MHKDQIVEATRQIREEQAAVFDFDIDAIVVAAQKRQKVSRRRVVSFVAPKSVSQQNQGKKPQATTEGLGA